MSSIQLRDYQQAHYARVRDIVTKYTAYVDTSDTGAGKSIIALKLAHDLGVPVMIVCPTSMVNVWNNLVKTYHIPYIDILSYVSSR